ncbi:MAG: electron transport complex subunit E [Pseudomonadales bacterium]|jgi:electron transport complex protein RnfE|nr:electron transport complex subunit E [Pseudomonadales bacterium]MDA0761088.1 electron transport complex subunit E [Pseudomonadota bacterium]MDA0957050.1 electron transport complex subunit E [Pseudomonadota bacterium]MDA1207661.1 electron transport complex subunit E [Pseudomonadota bacterium]
MNSFINQANQGLWKDNPALVQLLGLCPLLAVSQTLVTGLTLGVITLGVLVASNAVISLIRRWLVEDIRLPMQILVIATMVTLADLTMQAMFFDMHQRVGLFIALIVTNCTILARAELFARRNRWWHAVADGFWMGLGFLWVIALLSGIREILGRGTLFDGLTLILGPEAEAFQMVIHTSPLLLVALAPGAFITLGCLVALKNLMDIAYESRQTRRLSHPAAQRKS